MKLKLLLGACAVVALSGCSASLDLAGSPRSVQGADMSSYFDQRLDEGRRLLAAERPERAIDAFRQASYDHRLAPEAFNGMGVAYAMMGRTDVARRMFERAFEANPSDARILRNLARLDGIDPVAGEDRPRSVSVDATIPAPEAVIPVEAPPAPVLSADLEEGRRLLSEGRNLLAIERLRRAAEDDRVAGDAFNAMGVAYSRLGNEGVARRMFERAIENSPDDQRFARNLARLEGRPFPLDPNAALLAAVDPDAVEPQADRITVQNGELRKSAGEVLIQTSVSVPVREVQIVTQTKTATASAAPVRKIDERPDHPFPHYDYSEKLVATSRRVAVVEERPDPISEGRALYLVRLEPVQLRADPVLATDMPDDDAEPRLSASGPPKDKTPMNFRQAWLESCSA